MHITIDENKTYYPREGNVEITQQDGSLKYTITFNQEGRVAVNSIELDKTRMVLKPGETITLAATVKPDNATDKTITWTSTDPGIASVDENGKVTALVAGEVNITASAEDKTANCLIVVTDPENEDDSQGYIPDTIDDNSDYDW